MKILMYSDIHISKTSSILPLTCDGSKYTYRQQMIIDTGKYIASLADEHRPDLIINLGDTFDQHTVTSYDIDTASEFFKCFRYLNIPHLVIVGNHEMVNYNFNAIQLLSNITNITVISEPCSVDTKLLPIIDGYNVTATKIANFPKIAIIPYCNHHDILEFPEGNFLFSHLDIQGASIRGDITLADGISTDLLKQKYQLVFNGHIHKPSILGNVVNVGSITTHSFADDNETVPQCYIFDTDTLDLQTFKPTICPLFRKIEIQTLDELKDKISRLDSTYKYIITCTCPFNIKESIKTYLNDCSSVLNFRLNVKIDKENIEVQKEDMIMQQSNLDIVKSFKEFLNTVDLKYPKELYIKVLDTMKESELVEK